MLSPHACAWVGCGTFCHEMFLMAPLARAMSDGLSLARFFSQDHLRSLAPTYAMSTDWRIEFRKFYNSANSIAFRYSRRIPEIVSQFCKFRCHIPLISTITRFAPLRALTPFFIYLLVLAVMVVLLPLIISISSIV